jgi:hypothetical protein
LIPEVGPACGLLAGGRLRASIGFPAFPPLHVKPCGKSSRDPFAPGSCARPPFRASGRVPGVSRRLRAPSHSVIAGQCSVERRGGRSTVTQTRFPAAGPFRAGSCVKIDPLRVSEHRLTACAIDRRTKVGSGDCGVAGGVRPGCSGKGAPDLETRGPFPAAPPGGAPSPRGPIGGTGCRRGCVSRFRSRSPSPGGCSATSADVCGCWHGLHCCRKRAACRKPRTLCLTSEDPHGMDRAERPCAPEPRVRKGRSER